MNIPEIDAAKLPAVKSMISGINRLAVDEGCGEESPELQKPAQKLREVTDKNS